MSKRVMQVMEVGFSIHLGALAPKLSEQFKKALLPIDAEKLEHWQKDADAISRLAVRNLITEAQAHRARQKLCKIIAKEASKP